MANVENLQQKAYRVRTDTNGFIIGESDLQGHKTTQPVDVVFFGGSSTECGYVDEEKRFPYRVGELLITQSGLKARTLNGGVSGNHSLHSLIQFLAKAAPLQPRYVVLMHNINDLTLLTKTGSYWRAPPSRALVSSLPDTSLQPLFDLPAIFKTLQNLLPSPTTPTTPDEWSDYRIALREVDQVEIERLFRASITSFVNTVRAFGVKPILMTQFNRIKTGDSFVRATYERDAQVMSFESFTDLYAQLNQIIRDVATQEDVYLIDLDRMIPSTNVYIYDAVHLNGEGSLMVAKTIAAALNSYDKHFVLADSADDQQL